MEIFFSWPGWNAINALTQIVIAIVAIIAIVVTLKQVGNNKTPKLYLDFKLGMGMVEHDKQKKEVVYAINIKIANCGISPVFIADAGIEFVRNGKVITGMFSNDNEFFIQPGESRIVFIGHVDELLKRIESKVSANDKTQIYVDIGTGDKFTKEIEYDYVGFKFECEKMSKKVEESNQALNQYGED